LAIKNVSQNGKLYLTGNADSDTKVTGTLCPKDSDESLGRINE